MEIVYSAEFTIADLSSQASLTMLVFPSRTVPAGKSLADLPGSLSLIIDALDMRHLAAVPTDDALTFAVAVCLLEEHADQARSRFSALCETTTTDAGDIDAQLRAFAHHASHEFILPMWKPAAAPRTLSSYLSNRVTPYYQPAVACLVAVGATPLLLLATPEGIVLCGDAEGVSAAQAERRFEALRVWRTHGTTAGPTLRRYLGYEVPWSNDMLYDFVAKWARLRGLDPRNLPDDASTRRELRQHLSTVESNLKETERLLSERLGPSTR